MQSMLALLHSLQETITSASMCDTGGVNAGKAKVEALAAIGYVIFKLCQLFVSTPKHLHNEVVDLHNKHGVIVLLNLFASLGTGLVAAIRQNCSFVHILDMRELYVCVLNHLRSQKIVEHGGIVMLHLFAGLVTKMVAALETGLCIHVSYT